MITEEPRTKHYDLTEQASERSEGKEATNVARSVESDDVGDGSGAFLVEKPDGDAWAENNVATSSDDE